MITYLKTWLDSTPVKWSWLSMLFMKWDMCTGEQREKGRGGKWRYGEDNGVKEREGEGIERERERERERGGGAGGVCIANYVMYFLPHMLISLCV